MRGDVSFFSIGVADVDRARAFYCSLFGWTLSEEPSGRGVVIEGSTVAAGIHGDDPGASPYLFFRVDDIDAALLRVRELGGVVEVHDPDDSAESVARFGRFALCRDDQGSSFGLHQTPPEPQGETRSGIGEGACCPPQLFAGVPDDGFSMSEAHHIDVDLR